MSLWRTSSRQRLIWPVDQQLDMAALQLIDETSFSHVAPWVRLGEPYAEGESVCRDIVGGVLARTPGGRVCTGMRRADGRVHLYSAIEGYAPRLPRPVYRALQNPVHRLLMARSARRAAASLFRRSADSSPGGQERPSS